MRDAEILARHAVEEIARYRFARCEADGVDQAVERLPAFFQRRKQCVDLRVVGDVAGEHRSLPNSVANSVMRSLKRSPHM